LFFGFSESGLFSFFPFLSSSSSSSSSSSPDAKSVFYPSHQSIFVHQNSRDIWVILNIEVQDIWKGLKQGERQEEKT